MLLIKAGGGKGINWEAIGRDLAALRDREKIVLVHGASQLRDELAGRLSIPVKTVVSPSGVTSVYTDAEALDVFLMAYAGLANKKIVAALLRHGLNAVGLCGVDGGLWRASPKKDLMIVEDGKTKLLRNNLTGRVEKTNAGLVRLLLDHDYLPVICAPAVSTENQIVNTDNDWAAAVMAGELGIKKVVYLFEAPGLLRDLDRPESLIPLIQRSSLGEYLPFARGRMKKKVLGAQLALDRGVEAVYFGDGRIDHPVLSALEGQGTVIK